MVCEEEHIGGCLDVPSPEESWVSAEDAFVSVPSQKGLPACGAQALSAMSFGAGAPGYGRHFTFVAGTQRLRVRVHLLTIKARQAG